MATSGSANSGSGLGGSYIRVAWDRTGTGTNSSTIRVRVYLELRGGYSINANESGYARNDNNSNYSRGSTARGPNGTHLLHTYTRTLGHDVNGRKTLSWGGSFTSGWTTFGTLTVSNRNSTLDRRPLAPTNNAPSWSNVLTTTATVAGSTANHGHGTSSTITLRYKKASSSSWTQLSAGTPKNITGMTSNSRYDLSSRASNNNGDTSGWTTGSYQTVTRPLSQVMGTPNIEAVSATIPVTQNNGDGIYTITRQYRYRKVGESYGSWTNNSSSINLTDLSPSTEYQVEVRSTTTAGTTTGGNITFTTLPAGKLVYPNNDVVNGIPRIVEPGGAVKMVQFKRVGQ